MIESNGLPKLQICTLFVEEQPQGYETTVGEAGVRLLWDNANVLGLLVRYISKPAVLVLDEATNALDNLLTEQAVMDAITNMDRDITIINITHRVRTLEGCDLIYVRERKSYSTRLVLQKHFRPPFHNTRELINKAVILAGGLGFAF